MRILLISPSETNFVNYSKSKRTICVALPLLAAYTPPEHEVITADEGYGDSVYFDNIDLVGISAMTAQAYQGYRIAKHYREKGVKVVMGGIHASVLPDEALQHVDSVCVGEGDAVWAEILKDASANGLKKIYRGDGYFPIEKIPPLRLDVIKRKKTTFGHTVIQASRGCPYSCEFCITSSLFGRKYRFRPVDNIIDEIKMRGRKLTFFVDDNIFASPDYCEELFNKLLPLKIRWAGQASLHSTTRDPSLLRLARKSGALGLFVGLESVNQVSKQTSTSFAKMGSSELNEISKKIKVIIDHDIMIQSSIIFGMDGDDPTVFEKTIDFLKINNVSLSSFCIMTPYPGTKTYERFKKENRLIHEDWSKYSNENVVFYPSLMTPEQLKKGSDWAGRQFYKWSSIAARGFANRHSPFYYLMANSFTRRANIQNHGPGAITRMSNIDKLNWRNEMENGNS